LEHVENQLRESEEKYDLLADNSKEGIYLIDSLGLDYVNRAFEAITGYSASEANGPGFDLLSLLLPEDRALIRERRERETFGLQILPSAEFRIRTKSGQVKHIENNTVLLPSPPQRILGILRDVTDRKLTEGELKKMMAMMRHTLDAVILAIGRTVELRDPYTAGHQRRVADLSRAIAQEVGLPQDKIDGLGMASLIHDLGKISVPAEILSKPGRLSEMEYNMIKSHPQFGYNILESIEFPWPVARIVLQHHERMNGSGYPAGLDDGSILLEARILGLADVVEAMISHRPYRPARSLGEALAEISKNRGTLYDGQAVEACRRLFLEERFHFQGEVISAEAAS
jgi:PAS domain S-box-containing protein